MASMARMMMVAGRGVLTNGALPLNSTDDATKMLISDLRFAQSKSVRTSTIILAAFNVLAAFSTALSILYDCYWASKRCNPKFKASKFCVSSIHPAETFPLILSIGIVIQGLVFAASQGQGMQALYTDGCDIIAQYMLPALFIVPFIQAVFGLECAFRSMRKLPFQARGKYNVTICSVIVFLMLVGTWVPTFISKQPKECFASLLWFVSSFGTLMFLMLSILAGLMIVSAATIFIRLSRVTLVDQHQRIAASRMVYYLVLGIMSLALVIPYFGTQSLLPKGSLKLAMMGTVVVNLSGLMNGLLHLFLRSNTTTASFGPKKGRHGSREKHEIRLWGPNELAFSNYLVNPVSGPQSPQSPSSKFRSESRTSLVKNENMGMASPPFRSPGKTPPFPITPIKAQGPAVPEPAKEKRSFASRCHSRKPSYSLFPLEGGRSPVRQNDDVGSIYDITDLQPPPRIQLGKGHLRNSSVVSSATVQIGLRLSHAPGTEPAPLPSSAYNPKEPGAPSSGSLLLPIAFGAPAPKSENTLSSKTFGSPTIKSTPEGTTLSPKKFTPPPSKKNPLQVIISAANTPRSQTPELPLRSPRRLVPPQLIITTTSPAIARNETEDPSPRVNKDLPPTPRLQLNPVVEALRVSTTQLVPAIYSPNNASDRKPELALSHGLPSAPKRPMGPGSVDLQSPSSNLNGSPRIAGSRRGDGNQESNQWI